MLLALPSRLLKDERALRR